jgi:uncharacterized coiled-coil protein SlyX
VDPELEMRLKALEERIEELEAVIMALRELVPHSWIDKLTPSSWK